MSLYEQIKSVEEEAQKILADAEKQHAAIIKKAHDDVARLRSEKEALFEQLRTESKSKALADAEKKRELILSKEEKNLAALQAAAEKKMEKARSFLMDSLNKSIEE